MRLGGVSRRLASAGFGWAGGGRRESAGKEESQ